MKKAVILAGFMLLTLLMPTQAQYPGAAIFGVECAIESTPEMIRFSKHGSPLTQLAFSQIATPLAVAVALQQNQPISSVGDAGIWALKSDEIQIHLHADPDGTKLVLRSDVCGAIPRPTLSPQNAQVIALAQAMGGQASAFAAVTADCRAIAIAEIVGPGMALAYVQSSGCPSTANSSGEGRTHTVQSGENMFRISLRYGTTVAAIAQANNITNPALIYVGQVLIIP